MKKSDAKVHIVARFLRDYPEKRTGNDVFAFYNKLVSEGSPLLNFQFGGDRYQQLQAWLSHYLTR
jgi:hypothetical protein